MRSAGAGQIYCLRSGSSLRRRNLRSCHLRESRSGTTTQRPLDQALESLEPETLKSLSTLTHINASLYIDVRYDFHAVTLVIKTIRGTWPYDDHQPAPSRW
jgi:hypothetical protein